MKEFIVRLFSLLAIVGVLFGYNEVLDVRAKDEEIAKLNAQLEVQSSGYRINFFRHSFGNNLGNDTFFA